MEGLRWNRRVGLWKSVGTLGEDCPFSHCHVSLCKYKTFPASRWALLARFYRQSRHWARTSSQGTNLSFYWANLDHPDSGDRTFELTVESPGHIGPKKFPGESRNAPGWAKVIWHLLICMPTKEDLLRKRKVQNYGPIWFFFLLSHIFWVHLCPRNISKISQTSWEGWPRNNRAEGEECVLP